MNKAELANAVSDSIGISKAAALAAVGEVFEQLETELSGGDGSEVRIGGFGTFKTVERAARTGRNPSTGESIQIAAKNVVTFKAAKGLKDSVL